MSAPEEFRLSRAIQMFALLLLLLLHVFSSGGTLMHCGCTQQDAYLVFLKCSMNMIL